ncbi:MAG: cytochrome b/b6 domain-containing protein [Proteobacteria bacterium]|nr:cytochrome b [Methylibium sp.]MBY0366655.1 cytochrome b/b6 domain-containing protein [Burkholderiaceae bacterium]MCH8855445.1 cytochrome b/b6 domain-containing protein [Pseudomonadota bacterium]|mmetsp:Transcript_23909/g.56777  ORF Transcript_23909/g.56777 Transcript_23909/m.56777 type:complete len:225 (+) Transcript_23909:925-1599(+)
MTGAREGAERPLTPGNSGPDLGLAVRPQSASRASPRAPLSTPRYDPISRSLHWLTALAATAAFLLGPEGFGRLMHEGVDPATRWDIVWHESLGLLVLGLTLLRLLWVALRPGKPHFDMPLWMRLLSRAVHGLLWLLLLALPLTALLALGSEGHPLTLLGGVRLNQFPGIAGSALGELTDWGELHGSLGDALIALAGAHALAALYHHFGRRDGVLAAMLPWRLRR